MILFFLILCTCLMASVATIAPTVEALCIFKTSSSLYSGTLDSIYASFIGDIATSGPHTLGSFSVGSRISLDLTLHKVVGELSGVLLFTNGTDGWLLSEASCQIDDRVYALRGKRQWLDSLDVDLLKEYGDGNEPLSQEDTRTLPSSPTLLLGVADSWRSLTSKEGVFKPHIAGI